jgi:hypothetical protein
MFDTDYEVEMDLEKLREQWVRDGTRAAKAREMKVRSQLARRGYRLMHRRKGQYWVMLDEPMTFEEIDAWINPQMAQ